VSILGNLAQVALDGAASLVAANNPTYDGVIALAQALGDHTNQVLNPDGAASQQEITTTASNLAQAIPDVVSAVKTISAGAAPATAKAASVGGLLTVGEDLVEDFLGLFARKANPLPAATATSPASSPAS
jgi:hypothetical protein